MLRRIGTIDIHEKFEIIDSIVTEFQTKHSKIEGEAYYGYPIYINEYDKSKICVDLALITKRGVFIFNVLLNEMLDYPSIQDEIYTKIELKFKKQQFLLQKKNLIFNFHTITYSTKKVKKDEENDIAFSYEEAIAIMERYFEQDEYEQDKYNKILSGIQEAYGINNRTKREGVEQGTKAYAINQMNYLIEKYDSKQMEAILADSSGIQRIRGMAGSGKTIILARKAVELHTAHPDWTIVVTYSTRSLKNQLVNLISKFYALKNEGAKYDESKLKIMQSWGSSNAPGVYYDICLRHGASPMTYSEAKNKFGKNQTFSKMCREFLNQTNEFCKLYDCILIDEAQDFDKNFMKLCLSVLDRNERLVYAYDELQKLNEETMPSPKEIFGKDIEKDTPLTVCYRNQGPVIVTAHAIGMGLYRESTLIQLPSSPDVWSAIGYVSDNDIVPGEPANLYRTPETSPELLKAKPDEIIDFITYENFNSMGIHLLKMIKEDIYENKLLAKDIMIIDLNAIDSVNNKNKLFTILVNQEYYGECDLNIHSAGTSSPEDFFRDNSIVYSTIYRAKGNEAFMVYILNAQRVVNSFTPKSDRNALFTAITRSKGWVKVLGYGDEMDELCCEFNKIKDNNFTLNFDKYPTKEEQKMITLNNQDLGETDVKKIDDTKNLIRKLQKNNTISNAQIVKELFGISSKEELMDLFFSDKEEE